ncbi:MAG: GGDEF domain-containing protein [Sulfurimonas sp.]|nr:GGDEF domain-containing protein [Sulfurimonas sp.]
MKEDDILLRIITNETKNSIENLNVVTPAMYESLFSKYAFENNTTINNNEDTANHFLNEQISQLTDMQTKTSENVQKLSDNTNKALSAIKGKDETLLMEVLQEAKSLRSEVEKLKKSVYKDELTHAYNRKWLHDNMLDHESKNLKESGSLAIIDINYFKIINDTHGHIVGDKILIFITNELKKISENIIRYGGDEFIIIFCNNTKKETAISQLIDIRDNILKKHMKIKSASFKVSFSVGAQEFKRGDNINDVIEKADKSMYDDKKEIKKRVTGI